MKVEIFSEKISPGYLVKLKGDVDMNSSSEVRSSLVEIFRTSPAGTKALLIDLSGVRYMDSSGIATLVEALQTCMKQGMRLRLVELSAPVRDVFELARLASVFEIFASQSDALAGL